MDFAMAVVSDMYGVPRQKAPSAKLHCTWHSRPP